MQQAVDYVHIIQIPNKQLIQLLTYNLQKCCKLSSNPEFKDPKPRSLVSRYVPLVHTWCRKLSKQTEVSKIRQHSLALEEQGKNRKTTKNERDKNKTPSHLDQQA